MNKYLAKSKKPNSAKAAKGFNTNAIASEYCSLVIHTF
jgi:hypothetical protein